MGTVVVRAPRVGDGAGIARMHLGNAAHYAELAPDLFKLPDDEGLVEFFERGIVEDSARPNFVALVAEIDGEVAGYLVGIAASPDGDGAMAKRI